MRRAGTSTGASGQAGHEPTDRESKDRRRERREWPPIDDEPEGPDAFIERRLVVPASDTKGRSERIWVRMQPQLIRASQLLVSSRRFPWRTPGDFHRFAIHDTLRRVQRDAPDQVVTILGQLEAMKDILQHEEMHAEFVGLFDRAAKVIEVYRNAGANDEARRLIAELRAQINGMPAGYWKEKYRAILRERYKDLMSGEAGGSFISLTGDEKKAPSRQGGVVGLGIGAPDDDSSSRAPHQDDEDEESMIDEKELD